MSWENVPLENRKWLGKFNEGKMSGNDELRQPEQALKIRFSNIFVVAYCSLDATHGITQVPPVCI